MSKVLNGLNTETLADKPAKEKKKKKDIRSYFSKANGSSTAKASQNSLQSKKRIHRIIESDEENDEDSFVAKKKTKEQPSSTKLQKAKPEVVIQVENFFGSKPIQQKMQMIVPKVEGKKEKSAEAKKFKKRNVSEVSFENDDELEVQILQIDDEQLVKNEESSKVLRKNARTPKKENGEKQKTPKKEGNSEIRETRSPKSDENSGKNRAEEVNEVQVEPKKFKLEAKVESKFKNLKTLEKTLSAQQDRPSFKEIEKKSCDMLWVDKYKPKSTKNIVGQTGEKSNVKKLIKWLENWHKFHSNKEGKKLSRPGPWAQNDDGRFFKASLLSGPPGVGKTTTVHLVCKELGMDIIEFNASDTRSKKLLQEEVTELLSNRSIKGFLEGSGENYRKHVLLMDEVDGMAGNEDRGGVQELIQLIKHTKVPIIGICNDRNHPKMRSLVNYCFDLRFQRPRVEQIKGMMKSICFKEDLEISGEALEELIIASNHDLRQILHNLSLSASGHKSLSLEEAKKKGEQAKKPLNLSPWDVVRKVFSASEQEKMTFTDKTDLFFQDYSIGPLFVQDTYLKVKPYKAKNSEKKKLELISKAAESLALGDVVERTIRTQNAWSLLPVQAVFSSVLPGHYMTGHVQGQVQFPVWFGKNSRSNKMERLLQELHSSLRLNVTGTKQSINLDYLNYLKNSIVKPLLDEGVQGVKTSLEFMLKYHLTREDLDCVLELAGWPGVKDSFSIVDSKVKAALTRALNKESQMVVSKKNTKIKGDDNVEVDVEVEEETEETETDDVNLDPMIKVGKSKVKKEPENKNKTKKKQENIKGNAKKGKK